MSFYLIQYSYTPEAWRALVTGTAERDRHKAVERLLNRHGGRFPRLTFDGDPPIVVMDKFVAFGESDVIAIVYFPDNQRAAAFAMSVLAGGAVRSFTTTPLLTLEEAIQSMEMAGSAFATYMPPQGLPKP
jgi:uncharacterized protein with GYD domain